MAIYHFSMKTISRSHGRSATAAIAYRAGEKITDMRTGEVHDYQKKSGVLGTGIVLPNGAPEWAKSREQLWNAVEQKETRKNSTVAREIIVALPTELNEQVRFQMVHDFAEQLVERHKCAVDFAIHEPSKQGDERNYHAHILMSTRRLTADGFTEKTRELDERNSGEVEYWREQWANHVNLRLAEHGHSERISHLSLAEQGIDREPTKHKGVAATAIERRQMQQAQITEQYEPISGLSFGSPPIPITHDPELIRQIGIVENELIDLKEELRLESLIKKQEDSLYLQIAKHFCDEMLEELKGAKQYKVVDFYAKQFADVDKKFSSEREEIALYYYEKFQDELQKLVATIPPEPEPEPQEEVKDSWTQCRDVINETENKINELSVGLNDLEQICTQLIRTMEESGLYAYQGIKSLQDDLKELVQPMTAKLGSLKAEIDRTIRAWERDDVDGVEVILQYDYDKQKYDLSDDFIAKIDDFKVSQEPLKAFVVNHEQRFKARLAEPRDTTPTIGLKLPEPSLKF